MLKKRLIIIIAYKRQFLLKLYRNWRFLYFIEILLLIDILWNCMNKKLSIK